MPIRTQNRRFSRSRLLVFLGLAISVFAWGLQYKLSLYEPPTDIAHQVPKAKLLSHDEHFKTVETLRASLNKPVAPSVGQVLLLGILAVLEPLFQQVSFLAGTILAPRLLPLAITSGHFVRPPPSLA